MAKQTGHCYNESFNFSNGDKIDILSTINSVYGYFQFWEVLN